MDPVYTTARLAQVRASASIELSKLASQLRLSNPELIDLTAGEPDFNTPPNVCDEAIRAIRAHETRYTDVAGIEPLRTAIAQKLSRENRLTHEREEICVCSGAKAAIFNALLATVSEGDEVLIIAPYWVSYPDMVRVAGGTPVILMTSAHEGFRLTPTKLRAALSPRTRWLIINSPSNPAGVVYSAQELRAFGDILLEWPRALILSDEVYEHFVYGKPAVSVAHALPELRKRILTINSLSKSFGMTGWRIGYAAGARPLIESMTRLAAHSTANACTISQWAAVIALSAPRTPAAEHSPEYRRRRDLVTDMLNDIPGLHCTSPQGAFYVFPSCAGGIGRHTPNGVRLDTDVDFVRELLRSEAVATVFGSGFGMPKHFRLCLAAPADVLVEACTRIRRFCASLS